MDYTDKIFEELKWTMPKSVDINDIKELAVYELKEDLMMAQDDEDEEEIDKINKLLEIAEKAVVPYDFKGHFGDWEDIMTMVDDCEQHQEKIKELENLCCLYNDIIKKVEQICDFKIVYSKKSRSIYLHCNFPATVENADKLMYLNNNFKCCDTYDEQDCYNDNKNICIRISDHDFGRRNDEIRGEISYYDLCINYVLK